MIVIAKNQISPKLRTPFSIDSKWFRTLKDSNILTITPGKNVDINSKIGGDPAINTKKQATTVRIKLTT